MSQRKHQPPLRYSLTKALTSSTQAASKLWLSARNKHFF